MTQKSNSAYKPVLSASALFLALALTACGGGGSSSTPTEADTGDTGSQAPTHHADRYVGTWQSPCRPSTEVTRNGLPVNMIVELAFTKLDANTLQAGYVERYYEPGDTSCANPPAGTQTRVNNSNRLTLANRVSASFNSTMVEADAVSLSIAASSGLSSGGIIVINGTTFPGNYFQRTTNRRDLAFVAPDGKLYFGDLATAQGDAYPTTLDAATPYTQR